MNAVVMSTRRLRHIDVCLRLDNVVAASIRHVFPDGLFANFYVRLTLIKDFMHMPPSGAVAGILEDSSFMSTSARLTTPTICSAERRVFLTCSHAHLHYSCVFYADICV